MPLQFGFLSEARAISVCAAKLVCFIFIIILDIYVFIYLFAE